MANRKSIIKDITPRIPNPQAAISALAERHRSASLAVFIYYLFSVYVAYSLLNPIHLNALSASAIMQWPVAWVELLNWRYGPQLIAIFSFVAALACSLDTSSRAWRILFAFSSLMTVALMNSYGAVNHGYHIWLWIGALLAIAPDDLSNTASRRDKLGLLATVSGVQAFILLTYTLAGVHKLNGGLTALVAGDSGNFSLTGFAGQIAGRAMSTGTEPLGAGFIIANPALAAPVFWFVIFCQLFALGALFNPRLHRSFGFIMIAFHFGTWALMEISFPLHVVWLLLFFVFSPFRPTHVSDSPLAVARDLAGWGRGLVSKHGGRAEHPAVARAG